MNSLLKHSLSVVVGKTSLPAATGVCVVKTHFSRTASTASANVPSGCVSRNSFDNSRVENAAWPSFK